MTDGRFVFFKVSGGCMAPILSAGSSVMVLKAGIGEIRTGDIIAFRARNGSDEAVELHYALGKVRRGRRCFVVHSPAVCASVGVASEEDLIGKAVLATQGGRSSRLKPRLPGNLRLAGAAFFAAGFASRFIGFLPNNICSAAFRAAAVPFAFGGRARRK